MPPLREAAALDTLAARTDPVAQVRDRAGTERDVHIGIEAEDSLALRLRIAAADRDHLVGVGLLERRRLRQVGGEALVRLLANSARVEDDHVGLLLRDRLAQAERLEHAFDPLGIVRVHLAAEGRHVVALHRPEA
jgi:hypothetical protein